MIDIPKLLNPILYLFLADSIFGKFLLRIRSTSGDPTSKIYLLFSPICINLFLAVLLETKCKCDIFEIECLNISSTVPLTSPPSM